MLFKEVVEMGDFRLMAQKPWIVSIPGTTKLHHVQENLGAFNITFSSNELAEFHNALGNI